MDQPLEIPAFHRHARIVKIKVAKERKVVREGVALNALGLTAKEIPAALLCRRYRIGNCEKITKWPPGSFATISFEP